MEHFVNGFAFVLNLVFNIVQLLVIASVIISWVNADPYNPLVRTINSVTEPMYRPLRRFTNRIPGNLDWAPLAVILIVVFLQMSLIPWMKEISVEILRSQQEVLPRF